MIIFFLKVICKFVSELILFLSKFWKQKLFSISVFSISLNFQEILQSQKKASCSRRYLM